MTEVLEDWKDDLEKLVKMQKEVSKYESRIKELKNSLEDKNK